MQLTKLSSPLLILGAAHGGKSALAMQALAPDASALVIGTGVISDLSFGERIDELKALRPVAWNTIETNRDIPATLAQVLRGQDRSEQVLVDSLSQWLAAAILESVDQQQEAAKNPGAPCDQQAFQTSIERQLRELEQLVTGIKPHQRLVLVSSEAGAGPAPARTAERLYRKYLGLMNQMLARTCKSVILVTAGIPQILKG